MQMTWSSARQARFLDAPDAVEYLKRVKKHFRGDSASLVTLLRQIRSWIETESTNPGFEQSAIAIACTLRTNPPLLHGFNSLLKKGYRIEFSNKIKDVDLFVWATPAAATIRSLSGSNVPSPYCTTKLRDQLSSDKEVEDLLTLDYGMYGDEYLTCLSQLLQFIMDDTATDAAASRCRRNALRFLRQLATKRSILPPSLFLNNLKREGSTGVQHAVGVGGSADIFKDRIQGTVFCFRVLRMFVTAEALGEREKAKALEERKRLYKEFCSEVLVWRQLKHPNILPFLGASTELFSPRFCFISLWMKRGDIMSYLKQNPHHDRFAAVCHIVDGVEYLHTLDPPVTHKDIKGANVLVTDEGICCLADFGLSSIFDSQRVGKSPGFEGSICWLAPELMEPVRPTIYDAKAGDIYALACTIYEIYTGKPPLSDLSNVAAVIVKVLIQKERAPLPPEGTWTYEEQQLWVLVEQSWTENPEERYEIRKIKNFLKDLVCDKTVEGPQGGSPSPSPPPETDSASEAARDLDRVRIWLDAELDRHSISVVGRTMAPHDAPMERTDLPPRSIAGKFAKRSLELRALPPTPLDLITIRHPQGLVTPNTPSSTQILPILESPHSENHGSHFSSTLHNLYAPSPISVLAKTQSRFPLTPPCTPAHAFSTQNPSTPLDTIQSISTSRKPFSSSPLVFETFNSQRDRHEKLRIVAGALDGSESTSLHSISSPFFSSNGYALSISPKAKRPVEMRSTQLNRRSTSSAASPLRLPIYEDNLSP